MFSPRYVFPDKCLQANGGCSHQCSVAPSRGMVCSCPTGLHLASDNKTCEVVDYCTRHLKCSQRCEQYKTTVKCFCYPGWRLDLDGESCHSTGTFTVCAHSPFKCLLCYKLGAFGGTSNGNAKKLCKQSFGKITICNSCLNQLDSWLFLLCAVQVILQNPSINLPK